MHDIPEKAIACFEAWSNLKITFYDWTNSFANCFHQERRMHNQEFCKVEKCSRHSSSCIQFDFDLPQQKAWMLQDGAVKICHAGALEFVISIYSKEKFLAILTAGVLRPIEQLPAGIPVLRDECITPLSEISRLPKISTEEMELKLEGVRQLAARLKCWFEEKGGKLFWEENVPRSRLIEYTVQEMFLKKLTLEHMSKVLRLSRNRTAYAIREATGKTLGELIREKRFQRARILLEHTDRPIAEVAENCGYPDLANFHRQFKKIEGATPAQFRSRSRSKQNSEPSNLI